MAVSEGLFIIHLCIEGPNGGILQGESNDAVHTHEIQVQSFDIGVSAQKSGGEGAWRPDFAPISIILPYGRASPSLFRAACGGTIFKRWTISTRKQGASQASLDNLQWRFGDVQVIGWQMKVDATSKDVMYETVQFSYQSIEVYYAVQGNDGSLKDPVKRSWSLNENKEGPITLPFIPKGAK